MVATFISRFASYKITEKDIQLFLCFPVCPHLSKDCRYDHSRSIHAIWQDTGRDKDGKPPFLRGLEQASGKFLDIRGRAEERDRKKDKTREGKPLLKL